MKECHVCHYICDDNTDICPVCGAELIKSPDDNGNNDCFLANPTLAVSVDSPVTAEIFKDILSDNEILYSIDDNGDTMHTGFGGSYFAIDFFVDDEDVDAVKELYRNLTENQIDFDDFEDFSPEESDGE